MPFKSQAQRKKFHALLNEGKISKETVDKWEAETPNKPLPKRVQPKPTGLVRRPRRDAK